MKNFLALFAFIFAASAPLRAQNPANPVARFHTDLGDIDVVLLRDIAPNTVANFLRYVSLGRYDNTFVHRSVTNFVIQGGGYRFNNGNVETVPTDPPIANEFHVSNTRGTLAMAKLSGDPNSATSQWFFNESDTNAPNLDNQNGGFTVFGRISGGSGLSVMDAIAAVPTYNFGSPFDQLPLRNYSSGGVQDSNFVHLISVKVISKFLALTHPSANVIHLQGSGAANVVYRIEAAATPAASDFTMLTTLAADSGGNISYDDTNPGTKKFYRLVVP